MANGSRAAPPAAPSAPRASSAQALASCTESLAERERLLTLNVEGFDRSDDGWRPYGDAHCYSEAAGLIGDYLRARATTLTPDDEALLRLHAAQMLADANRGDDALDELGHILALEPRREHPDAAWVLYVQGTAAFLRQDRARLDQAAADLDKLAAYETGPVQAGDRLNLNALHGLQRCFGQNYAFAYASPTCRDLDEARRLNQVIG